MADDIAEHQESSLPKDPAFPLKVVYCPECSMPPEYCSYSEKFAKCKPWILKNFPHLLEDGAKVDTATAEVENLKLADASTPAEKPKLLPGGKVKKQEPIQVIISSEQRQRKKTVTHVHGLGKFGIKLPDASKLFSKKFACSASAAKDKDSILIQGDVKDDLVDFLLATYPEKIKDEHIFFGDENGGKLTPARD